jgi:hypothetical protein
LDSVLAVSDLIDGLVGFIEAALRRVSLPTLDYQGISLIFDPTSTVCAGKQNPISVLGFLGTTSSVR